MQIVTILPETVKDIEGLYHNLFWSLSRERRKLHTVAWAKICRPLSMGGLGMLNLRDMNSMLLSKQLWKLVAWKQYSTPKVWRLTCGVGWYLKTRFLSNLVKFVSIRHFVCLRSTLGSWRWSTHIVLVG